MKIVILLLCLFISRNTYAEVINLKIEDIVKKVSDENFMVLENAERVYQRKEKIKYSRAGLLPKLNIWNLLKIPALIVDPLAIGDIIQDVAPFLVPANWFKVGQAKHLYKSQQEQYRAVWANEVNTAKLLFTSVYRDIKFQELLKDKSSKYKDLLDLAQSRNVFGDGNIFAYNLIKDRYLSLVEDTRNLENLTFTETKELQYLTGINNEQEVLITPPRLPSLENAEILDFTRIIFKVIEASPETKQFEHMINALGKVKGEIYFNVLGTSTFSSGNGAFEDIPIQDGLGFGLGPSLRINKSEGRILKIQLKATLETLKKQVNLLVNEHNSLIKNYDITKQRSALAESNFQAMIDNVSIGGEVDALEMIEILDNLYAARILLVSYKFRYADIVEKLKRMTFTGDYEEKSNLTSVVTKIKAKNAAKLFQDVSTHLKSLKENYNLINLKRYSDSIKTGNEYLNYIVGKKSYRKRFKKFIKRYGLENNLCEKLLSSKSEFLRFSRDCKGYNFNSCPQTFNRYNKITSNMIDKLKHIYSSQEFLNTKCETFTYQTLTKTRKL
ncbi:MAG: TolC family protein [Bacteriovoracaceae bacterium]|nr:TolC family protein [Bacteriovoracaceae bacterium]